MAQPMFKVTRISVQFKKVQKTVDDGARGVLMKFGAFVRRTAKKSILKGKGISAVGTPPRSHLGTLKRFIFFAYEAVTRSVVIGPALVPGKRGDAPRALEKGGTVTIDAAARKRLGRHRRGRLVLAASRLKVKARPFMGPALEKERPKLPDMWRDSIRK